MEGGGRGVVGFPGFPGEMAYNQRPMGSERLLRFVFIFYCTTVGGILITLPWSRSWDLMIAYLPWSALEVFKLPWIRGLLSGFGLVHLVWALNDVVLFTQPFEPHADPGTKAPGDR